jgi:hypothetical protein
MRPEIRLTPPLLARRLMAGLVIPCVTNELATFIQLPITTNHLNVVPQDFPVSLSASFPQTFASFSSSRHVVWLDQVCLSVCKMKLSSQLLVACWKANTTRRYLTLSWSRRAFSHKFAKYWHSQTSETFRSSNSPIRSQHLLHHVNS